MEERVIRIEVDQPKIRWWHRIWYKVRTIWDKRDRTGYGTVKMWGYYKERDGESW